MDKLPTAEEFKKLSSKEQKQLVESTNLMCDRKPNRKERRMQEKLKRQERRKNG